MNKIIKMIEKMKPFFEKIASNPYLTAIRDGFVALMPVVLFSSLFILVAYVPNVWGFHWPKNIEDIIMKVYNFTMGMLAVFMAGTVTKSLTDNRNLKLPKTNQINVISTFVAAEASLLILAVKPIKDGISIELLGTKGLIAAFLVAFIVPNIYKFCIGRNITIKMPPQVPGNIAQAFKDMIPFALSVTFFWIVDIVVRALSHGNTAELVTTLLSPLFRAANGYLGFAIIFGFMAFFWFIGVHGPSVVGPAVIAIMYNNQVENLRLFRAGEHAHYALTQSTQDFVALIGGTGATLLVPYIFIFLCKSPELKAVGKASVIPTTFAVNEPLLFGAPIILNPVFMVPFIITPILNSWILKFFVDNLGMNGFMHFLPWPTPGPIGIYMASNFSVLSLLLIAIILVLDFTIWFPFIKAYDKLKLDEEHEIELQKAAAATAGGGTAAPIEVEENTPDFNSREHTNVLVVCAGGGTSGILANSLNKYAKENDIPLEATARAYGQDMDLIKDMDIVILAPQMDAMKDEMRKYTDQYGAVLVPTTGKQYIGLTRDGEGAMKLIFEKINEK
ncbi:MULTISPECIES: PTS lactose transporter subunit IIBC [Staphylococcus]|uniref:PTS system lactose-specific EIICB component n=1 Tax=Staphylococcus simulans UMC-CNS-990 TaxID=1405498 RepID=A0ABN0PBE2_STASI|nr:MULTISPECIES: PTS lactose transporter subunit IIBC [Staphylococcus]AVO02625.1 PTS lactose transporter subunit IIB [Staphylococcus simulans]AVO05570.1 PTS lactose transporter subunit IIB [Staphylococcus simulans]AWG19172.1 PTS lactose transporter subunit IIB [Staphylococcus simulans]AWI02121.1 PTS lactose transporter subunit IIB [Staphylococcus simulans]EKS26363.1 PTS system, lactose-specific IIC component [Staphylococcus simulans ACS-120-V-Sch1]